VKSPSRLFEWDPRKSDRNAAKHGIDFLRATAVFNGPTYTDIPLGGTSIAVGVDHRFVTVVWTWRGEVIRIISARRSRDAEIRGYRALHAGRD
jgi:uncharacterized protein